MSCEPTFELRFSNDIHMHNTEKEKCIVLMKQFIKEYIEETKCDCHNITIFPVARLGFSGAKVFYVNIIKNSSSEQDIKIAKFDLFADIEKEAKKAKSLEQEVYGPYKGEKYVNDQGLLIYKEVPYGNEFLNIMMEEDIPYCCNVLSNLYPQLISSMYSKFDSKSFHKKSIIDDYEKYLNRKNNPIQKAEIVADYFKEEGQKLFKFYNDLVDNPKIIYSVIVHGDLHARNILANREGAYLIDFDWVHEGHVAKDFTLLESTVLYMILPKLILEACGEHISYEELQKFHKQLYQDFLLLHFEDITGDNKDKYFAKAFKVIKVIRKYAQVAMSPLHNKSEFKDEFEEYKYSLILIGLSQISFQDANLEVLVHTTNYIIGSIE